MAIPEKMYGAPDVVNLFDVPDVLESTPSIGYEFPTSRELNNALLRMMVSRNNRADFADTELSSEEGPQVTDAEKKVAGI